MVHAPAACCAVCLTLGVDNCGWLPTLQPHQSLCCNGGPIYITSLFLFLLLVSIYLFIWAACKSVVPTPSKSLGTVAGTRPIHYTTTQRRRAGPSYLVSHPMQNFILPQLSHLQHSKSSNLSPCSSLKWLYYLFI
jgi:hypothetical protein